MDNNIADSKEFSPSTNDKELAEYQEALENKRKNFIVFDNVTKEYKNEEVKTVALSEVSFVIPEGELVIFLGHSGAGKTTALNMLGGMDIVTSGTITVDGKRITDYNIDQLTEYRKNDIGFVFQFFNLIQNLTVKENIELSTEIKGTTPDVKALLQKIELENKIDKFPSQLSGGEQQRVSIVRAIAKKPRILLCDEPTGSLDSKTSTKILKQLIDLHRSQNVTLIIVTHDMDVAKLADRTIEVLDGKLVNAGENSLLEDKINVD